jgi:hypothetical protein
MQVRTIEKNAVHRSLQGDKSDNHLIQNENEDSTVLSTESASHGESKTQGSPPLQSECLVIEKRKLLAKEGKAKQLVRGCISSDC